MSGENSKKEENQILQEKIRIQREDICRLVMENPDKAAMILSDWILG